MPLNLSKRKQGNYKKPILQLRKRLNMILKKSRKLKRKDYLRLKKQQQNPKLRRTTKIS